MNVLILNPPRRDNIVMDKEGRCMQRKGAWGYLMAPVTMVTIATMLRELGHNVTVLDCNAAGGSFSAMLASAERLSPDIVYINTSTPTIEDDISAAKNIKESSSRIIRTVLFGIHPSCQYDKLLLPGSGVDCCIIGEPEFTARDLALAVAGGEDLRSVAGIAFLDDSRNIVLTSPRGSIANLDELPVPDWSFIDTGNYRLPLNNRKFLLVNTNRGCPFRCAYCNAYVYYGRTHRHRSAGHIMRELKNNVEKFGVTDFMFWAEEFILDKKFVLGLCSAIMDSGLSIKWVCNSRVDGVDEETLTAVRQAGCWNISFGIESGSQAVLDRIGKGITLEQSREAVILAKRAGLQVTGHVIIGFPYDTLQTIAATERFVNSLPLDFVQYYCAMPYPGTQLYEEALAGNWLRTIDWRHWEHNMSVLDYPHLKATEIMHLRRKLMRRWYFSPGRVIKTLKNNIDRPSDLFALMSKIPDFVRWM